MIGTFPNAQDKALYLSLLQSPKGYQSYALWPEGTDLNEVKGVAQGEWDVLRKASSSLDNLRERIVARNTPDAAFRIELR